MKTYNLSLLAASLFTLSASAQAQYIFDIDGVSVETNYSQGPVSRVATSDRSAQKLGFHIVYNNPESNCEYANLYSREDGTLIANVQVTPSNYSNYVDYAIIFDLPESHFTHGKVLQLGCKDKNNQDVTILHKIPGVPKVTWDATVTPVGNFIYQTQSYSFHDEVSYQGKITVSNGTTESICKSVIDYGQTLNLFHGKSSHSNFYSDVFTTAETFSNTKPVLYQAIECSNSAGSTRMIKQWDLTDEAGITLATEETHYF
ncbi:hypothetical protein [Pseudoalteromonas denitrificans]|uniref:Uncharacterized protein n=1 Tax=Pseudoalteromonas denitrificans DSM 6059 TaxID=1123010 RepID=A0A1I1LG48_9GAMM|nr:hypothetical protein [Pseudoalteromonas denitrificans]SFC72019.1 hypothetical protein SAMN02745724_02364 [Pseudoalteromonas denitrificans DSM 6059]